MTEISETNHSIYTMGMSSSRNHLFFRFPTFILVIYREGQTSKIDSKPAFPAFGGWGAGVSESPQSGEPYASLDTGAPLRCGPWSDDCRHQQHLSRALSERQHGVLNFPTPGSTSSIFLLCWCTLAGLGDGVRALSYASAFWAHLLSGGNWS